MKNIVLIGMSGLGKTEIGKSLARSLGWDFLDTDDLIVKEKRMTIDHIFEEYGEEYFRDLETQVIKEVSKQNNTVISTGGGAVIREENAHNLRNNGYIILLMGKIETIVQNLNKSYGLRPLLKGSYEDLNERVRALYKKREHLYLIQSDLIIGVDDKTIPEISKEIIVEINKLKSRYN